MQAASEGCWTALVPAASRSIHEWSADGRFLMYMSIDLQMNADIWVVPMSGADRKPFVFLKTASREAYGESTRTAR